MARSRSKSSRALWRKPSPARLTTPPASQWWHSTQTQWASRIWNFPINFKARVFHVFFFSFSGGLFYLSSLSKISTKSTGKCNQSLNQMSRQTLDQHYLSPVKQTKTFYANLSQDNRILLKIAVNSCPWLLFIMNPFILFLVSLRSECHNPVLLESCC